MAARAGVLFDEAQLRRRVRELGAEIARDYQGLDPVLVSVLKGAIVFVADLMRAIDLPVSVDFMSVSSYGGERGLSGVVRILKDLDDDIGSRDVIVVEDIIDTGLTLSYLLNTLGARRPASLEVCALLDRTVRRIPRLEVRYRGFEIPDVFVVGYGLDHQERYRNLPYIVAVDRQATLAEEPDLMAPYRIGGPEETAAERS
jgi:hypoxanthine phosphoribosyltransferase